MLGDKSWDGTCQSEMPLLLPLLTALVVHVQARKIIRYILNISQALWSVQTIQHPPLRYCCTDDGMTTADQSQSTAVTEAAVESCERQALRRDAEVLRLTMKHPHIYTITDTLVIGPMCRYLVIAIVLPRSENLIVTRCIYNCTLHCDSEASP
jgi:hypothetical protein